MAILLQSCAASTGFQSGGGHFQDRDPCVEMYPWRRICLSMETIHTSGECSRTSSTAICINWMCRGAKSADVNRPAQLHFLWTHCMEQSVVRSVRRQSITEHVWAASEDCHLFKHSWRHPAPLWCLAILAPLINDISYLYLLTSFFSIHCLETNVFLCCVHRFGISPDSVHLVSHFWSPSRISDA